MANKVSRGVGSVTIVDITDTLQVVTQVFGNKSRLVTYDPNTDTYTPTITSGSPYTLNVEMYIVGKPENIIEQAKQVEWFVRTDNTQSFDKVTSSERYTIRGSELYIRTNPLDNNETVTYRAEVTYVPPQTNQEVTVVADYELAKITLGLDGKEGPRGQNGISETTHIRYANSPDGKIDFGTDSEGKEYRGEFRTRKIEGVSRLPDTFLLSQEEMSVKPSLMQKGKTYTISFTLSEDTRPINLIADLDSDTILTFAEDPDVIYKGEIEDE